MASPCRGDTLASSRKRKHSSVGLFPAHFEPSGICPPSVMTVTYTQGVRHLQTQDLPRTGVANAVTTAGCGVRASGSHGGTPLRASPNPRGSWQGLESFWVFTLSCGPGSEWVGARDAQSTARAQDSPPAMPAALKVRRPQWIRHSSCSDFTGRLASVPSERRSGRRHSCEVPGPAFQAHLPRPVRPDAPQGKQEA